MDKSVAMAFHKMLVKQGIQFRLGTKVLSVKDGTSAKYGVEVEPAKGGPKDIVGQYISFSLAHHWIFV